MDEHIHTGFVMFVTIGVYALLFQWFVRLAAAQLVLWPPTEKLGGAIGALVHFETK